LAAQLLTLLLQQGSKMTKILSTGLMVLLASGVFHSGAVEAGKNGSVNFKGSSTTKSFATTKSTNSTTATTKTGGTTNTLTTNKVTFTQDKTKTLNTDGKKTGTNFLPVGKTDLNKNKGGKKTTYDNYSKWGNGWCGGWCGWGFGWGCGLWECCHSCVRSCGYFCGGCCMVVIIEVDPNYGVLPPPDGPDDD
jgi:hypothetical protein